MRFEGQTFVDQEVLLDGNEYHGCTFSRVTFRFSAIGGTGLHNCVIEHSGFHFSGPASETLAFMTGLYNGFGDGGRDLVESLFDNIRGGSGGSSESAPITFKPSIFIGHGRSSDYVFLQQFLQHRGYSVETFESSSRAGHSVKDVVTGMIGRASMAFLVHTAEDERGGAIDRARENVVHETGLFQGRLGYHRAIVLREEGCQPFSNLDGIQYIPYASGNIRGSFVDVMETIEREFPSAVQA